MLKAAEADCLAHVDRSEKLIIKQLLYRMAHADATGWPPVPSAASDLQDNEGASCRPDDLRRRLARAA